MHTIDTQRTYAPHEAGYWAAQQAGFAIIMRIEKAITYRDRMDLYGSRFDPETGEYVGNSVEYDQADRSVLDLAMEACFGNARTTIIAQARDDEAALLIIHSYAWRMNMEPAD